jgi:hypothetical protein
MLCRSRMIAPLLAHVPGTKAGAKDSAPAINIDDVSRLRR